MGAGNQGAGAGSLLLYGIFFVFVALMVLYSGFYLVSAVVQMFMGAGHA